MKTVAKNKSKTAISTEKISKPFKAKASSSTLTIYDLAKLAGVSPMTVSNSINRPDVVRTSTRLRVLELVKAYDFRPDARAKAIGKIHISKVGQKRSKTKRIGIVLSIDFRRDRNLFFNEILELLEKNVREKGYDVAWCLRSNELTANHVLLREKLDSHLIDGVALLGRVDEILYQHLNDSHLPMVKLGGNPESAVNFVGFDIYSAGYLSVEHLLGLGHRQIGYITYDDDSLHRTGFLQAVSDWNASHPQDLCQYEISFINASTEIQEGSHAVPKWVESGITCVVGRTDLCAIGAVSAAMRLGLSVPRDFSVVGCNNDSLGEFLFPSITTFGLDKKQLVDRAVKILFSQFGETQSATSHVIVPVELIVRQSSAQVRSTERSSIEPKQIGPS